METCEYGTLRDEMLRDRIVVGIQDSAMSEKLQLDPELTLEKTKRLVRQKEAVKEQHRELQSGATGSSKNDPIVIAEVKNRRGDRECAIQNGKCSAHAVGRSDIPWINVQQIMSIATSAVDGGHYNSVCFSKTVKI